MSAEVVANSKTVTGTLLSGTTLTMDTTADAGTAATLVVNGTTDDIINNGEKTAVAFTVGGLDADVTTGGSAVVTFTSSGGGAVQKTLGTGEHTSELQAPTVFGCPLLVEKKKTDAGGTPNVVFFFLMIGPPPRSTLFPYTTLFRSLVVNGTTDDIINNGEKTAVAFTVGGLDADVTTGGSAVVTFTSSGGGSVQKTLARGRKGVVEGKRGGFGGGRSLEKKKNDEGGGT